ncbi:SGNH/GDSL hydrolase family protein [Phytoactinopolyspora alkaliphila]|uniref:SGNH/GDSL hydrolase family protein n=1 Tax=Phytoactinopolyspora alkaliphila TaxID=1783498 RepID=A0A6N9YQV6_9ACTN|nr:SGNH/GDSL hydrolase family protein [Phytoactinopolyspora alkaliphila]NED97310.1 SGNH/GDSL hydrolase family protein [Phytoactinopolyspora alkaliphila]
MAAGSRVKWPAGPSRPRVRRTWTWTSVVACVAAVTVYAGSAASASPSAVGEGLGSLEAKVVRDAPAGVVSLGDSYSSGLGVGTYDDDCDRTPQSWGMLIFDDDVSASDRLTLACSGADIAEVYDQLEELERLGGTGGRLITLTVGGNDIGFASELANCFVPFVGCDSREAVLRAEIEALVDPLTDLYRAVQAAAPGDEVIVGGYPLLVPDPAVRDSCRALTPLLTTAEREMIRRLGTALNQVIDEAATAAGVRSAGAHLETTFDGREACANGPDDWINGLKLSWPFGGTEEEWEKRWGIAATFVRDSFHPNAAGQRGYADAFAQVWSRS